MDVNMFPPPGMGRHHRSPTGSFHQANSAPDCAYGAPPGRPLNLATSDPRDQVQREHQYYHHEHQLPPSSERRTEERPAIFSPHSAPVTQPAPHPTPESLEKMRPSYRPPPPPLPPPPPPPPPPVGPMDVHVHPSGPAAQRPVSAATILPSQDQRNRPYSQPVATDAMPPQVIGLNFQYDLNRSYQSQHSRQHPFTPHLPLSQPAGYAPHPPHSAGPPVGHGLTGPAHGQMPPPSARQSSFDLGRPPPPPTDAPLVSQSASHPPRPRQNLTCSAFCPPNCSGLHPAPRQPAHLTFQPGNPVPPPLPPTRSVSGQSPSELRPLNSVVWGAVQPAVPPPPPSHAPNHPPPTQQPSTVLPFQRPPPPVPQHLPPQNLPSQQRPSFQQQPARQHPPQQLAPQQPPPPQQPLSQSAPPTPQSARPASVPTSDNAIKGDVATPTTAALAARAQTLDDLQPVLVNEALTAALTPLQSGVEHLWSQVVSHFRGILDKVIATHLDTIKADRARMGKLEVTLKQKEEENKRLDDQRGKMSDRMMGMVKEMEDMKGFMKSQADAIVATQNEVARLAGEKGRLEVELASVRDVRSKVADSSVRPSPELVTILLQQEIALQVERKLQEAHKEVEEHRAARENAETRLSEMKQKLKALVGFDIGELERQAPSREATVVGSPPPKSGTHSRGASRDMTASSPPVPTPQTLTFLPPISAPPSPVVLRAAPPIQRRPSPRPHLPTTPISASSGVFTSIAVTGTQEETARSTSALPRPSTPAGTVPCRASTPVAPVAVSDENGVVAGVKRPRPGPDQDDGEPAPVRRLTQDSEGPRRDGMPSRHTSKPPNAMVPVPPIASISTDGSSNEVQLAMDVDQPQRAPIEPPPPTPPTPSSILSAAAAAAAVVPDPPTNTSKGVTADDAAAYGKEERETHDYATVKLEDQVDQLMDELVNFDDEPEEGEVTDTEEYSPLRRRPSASPPAPRLSSPAPAQQQASTSRPSPPRDILSRPPAPPAQQPPPSPTLQRQRSPSSAPTARPWGPQRKTSASFVPHARPWGQTYPSQPPPPSRPSESVKQEPASHALPEPPKLSVTKHWVLLYIDDHTQWKCRLCQTMPNPGKPRAVFEKNVAYDTMLQHSRTEHPVACADMAKLSNDKLTEMKARLPSQGR